MTAEHAERERDRLSGEVQQLAEKVRESEVKEEEAIKAKKAAENEWGQFDKLARRRDTTAELLGQKEETLANLGVTAHPDELRRQRAEKMTDAERHEATAADQLGCRCPNLGEPTGRRGGEDPGR